MTDDDLGAEERASDYDDGLPPRGTPGRDAMTRVIVPMTEYRAMVQRIAELEGKLAAAHSAWAVLARTAWLDAPEEKP